MFSYTKYTYTPVARHKLTEGLLEEKSSKHSTKCRGNPQESRRKYAEHFAGIVILASLCPGGGGGGTPRKIGWECAARFPKTLPYL